MPAKQSSKSGGKGNANNNATSGKANKSSSATSTPQQSNQSAASAAPAASAASPATAPSFDSLPHATSGERLKGVEVGSTIPALMSELGVLLQQTPGGSASGGGGGVSRGQHGGLLFEDIDFASDAAAVLSDDVSRRLEQIPPGALERLSHVFQLQRRQAQASVVAAAAASRGSAGGSGSPSAEVVDSEDDVNGEENEADRRSGSSGTTGHTTPAPPASAAAAAAATASVNAGGGGGGEYDPYSAAGRRHNLEEMFEMMQRSIGNYARNAAAAAAGGGGGGGVGGGGGSGGYDGGSAKDRPLGAGALAGDFGLDPSAYADPLTQLEIFRTMMVATSKGRGAGGVGLDGRDDGDVRSRGARGNAGATAAATGAGGRVAAGIDMQANNPFQSFLDVLGPQLFGQVRLQQRAATGKAAGGAAGAGTLGKDGDGGVAGLSGTPPAAMMRDLDGTPTGAANLSDLQKRVEQVRVLSSSTLEDLAADDVSDSTSGNLRGLLLGDGADAAAAAAPAPEPELSSAKVGYCLTEAAAVAVSMLWSYLGLQPQPPPLTEASLQLGLIREAMQSQANLLLFRLRQELAGRSSASLIEIARCFGGVVAAEPEDIYRGVNGVGVLLFFACKPLSLLERTCAELGISLSDCANADSNVMAELIAEKLAAFFYPMKEGKLTVAHLSFVPRMQVHEHAPGNYTCTVDNASYMGRMLRERLLSNRFSCNKIKWRAAVVQDKGELNFFVWHRCATPLSVHLLVRTSEPKKKKRSASAKDGGAADAKGSHHHGDDRELSATDELRANSALFMERHVTAAPGEMIGFAEDFLALGVALGSPTTQQHGYRTYNKADDRLVFQFSLQLSNMDGTSLDGTAAAAAAAAAGLPNAAAAAGANRNGGKQSTPHPQQSQQNAGEEVEPSVSGSIAGRTDGGDSKEDAEAELRAAVHAFTETETAARAVIADTAHLEYRHLQNDECRDAHQSRRRAEDRERKALLAKVGPPAELIKEVEKLAQAVQAAQQQISKLSKERQKDDKENEKMAEKLAQHQSDLAQLMDTLGSGEEELSRLEAETAAAERRIADKRTRQARKEVKRAEQNQWTALKRVLEPTSSSTHHDTLAINDFGSFLQSSVSTAAQPTTSMPPLATTSSHAGMSSAGGLNAFGTDPYSVRQATTTPPSVAANMTPVFSTQPKLGHVAGGVNGVSALHHPLLDGGGSSSASTHPGMVSPMVPPSPGVVSNASAAMGSRNSPASAVAASLGSPGMPLMGMASAAAGGNNGNANANNAMGGGNGVGGRSSVSPSNAMMMGGGGGNGGGIGSSNSGANASAVGPAGGLSFGLAPSLFSTNPVSHASHSNLVGGPMGPGAGPSNLYTSLDANAQPFSPSPPPGSPGVVSNSAHSHGGNGGGGGGGFAFTVTAGAGMHGGLAGPASSSPLYQAGQAFTSGHDLLAHSPSPFSTTPMSTGGNGLFMVGSNSGVGSGNAGDVGHHSGVFPQQPHNPNEVLAFSTSLQWRN